MALMLLVGTSSVWAAHGFFDGLKVGYYTASTGDVYTGYGTSTLNELKGDLYLKLLAVKTYDSGVTSVTIEVKEGNTVLISSSNANFKSSWSDNWNKEWELVTDTKLPSTLGTHNISVIAKTNNSTSVTYSLTYTIISDDPCPDGVIYRVAGNYSEITSNNNWCNGKKWDPSADENKMTCNEGIYTITYNNLPANTGDQQYAFKVVKDGNWGTAYPGDNYTFKLTEASNVTITFNSSTNAVSHTAKKSCNTPTAGNFTYTAPANLVYDGSEKAATVSWNGTQGGTITIYYKNGDAYSEEAPSAVGEYEVYVTTTENNNFCALTTKTKVGTFTITCPAPAEVPKFEVTQHEVVCGNTNIQKGIIKITNPVANYKYRLGNEGNTEYTLDANYSIPGIDGGAKYRISAVRYCGTAKSSTTNEEEYAEISKTDVKLTPTLTSTPIVKCGEGDNAYTPGTLVITNYNEDYNYAITPGVGTPTIDGTNATYSINAKVATEYTVIATHKEYNCSSVQAETTVALADNTPTLEEISISSNVQIVCAGDNNVTLTCNLVNPVGTPSYKWFKNGVEIVGETSNLIPAGTLNENTTFSVAVILDNNGCTKEFNAEKLIEVKVRPEAPKFNPNYMTVCQGQAFTLPGSENEGYIWSDALGKPTTANKPNGIDATTDYYAVISFGCPSDATLYTVNVNPLPTISITGNPSAVFYEDVVLTANATDGATVKWYEGGNEEGTGNTYVVTSASDAYKIVTAKAFLNGCESDEASHPVRFSAEDCGNIGSNNSIIITCDPGTYTGDLYCYIFGATTPKGWSDCKGTKTNGIWKWEFNNINEGDHSLIFHSNSKSNGKDCKTGDLDHKLQRGYQYDYALNGVNSNWCNEPHPTIDPVSGKKLQTITDPAVKTVSVETEPGEGNIIFEGQVVKTGCAETLTYGFAYSTDANADKSTWTKIQCTNVGNTVGTQFSGSKTELEDDTYYVCAYITNSEGTTYGTVTEVSVSTVKTPIRDVTLDYCNEDGEDIDDPNPMCKGAIAYVKLSYVGSKYSDIKWLIEGVETNLVTDEGDGVWSYEIQGDGSLSVELKNDENKDPAWPYSNKLPFTTIPEPIAPTISLDKSTLCSNDDEGATISLANTVVGQTYSLFKEIENGDDTQIGNDIECIEQNKESISFNLKGLDVAGRYYVIAKENVCNRTIGTTSVTLEVVNTTGLSISIEPNTAVVTPWEPVKLKITHTEGYQYNVTGLDGMVYTVNGDTYTVKIPLPEDGTSLDTDDNVKFGNIGYNISATLITGGDNQCIDPATCTITLTPYLEPCTQN